MKITLEFDNVKEYKEFININDETAFENIFQKLSQIQLEKELISKKVSTR
ncbi:hypothetical protein [Clostridioides sp. ZZV15-6597]|nr:hypothetical protein [Clostridioides sp. ZZV15-6597]